jgi:hypothetical protein
VVGDVVSLRDKPLVRHRCRLASAFSSPDLPSSRRILPQSAAFGAEVIAFPAIEIRDLLLVLDLHSNNDVYQWLVSPA